MIFSELPIKDLPKEMHPFQPFIHEDSKLLIVGSFVSEKSNRSMDFYYYNISKNYMWKIIGEIFFADKNHFVNLRDNTFLEQDIKDCLIAKKIAICDSLLSVYRLDGNSSDKNLLVELSTGIRDISEVLRDIPECKAIAFTGEDAMTPLLPQLNLDKVIKIGVDEYKDIKLENRPIRLYRMPTPSSQGGKWRPFEIKVVQYKRMMQEVGIEI